jgi:hypothetical protein
MQLAVTNVTLLDPHSLKPATSHSFLHDMWMWSALPPNQPFISRFIQPLFSSGVSSRYLLQAVIDNIQEFKVCPAQ